MTVEKLKAPLCRRNWQSRNSFSIKTVNFIIGLPPNHPLSFLYQKTNLMIFHCFREKIGQRLCPKNIYTHKDDDDKTSSLKVFLCRRVSGIFLDGVKGEGCQFFNSGCLEHSFAKSSIFEACLHLCRQFCKQNLAVSQSSSWRTHLGRKWGVDVGQGVGLRL